MRNSHLNEFIHLVEELQSLRLTNNVLSHESITIRLKDWSNVEIINFDEEDCRSFILSCRLLVQDNDRISVRCVEKIISNGNYSETAKNAIADLRFGLNLSLDGHCAVHAPGCDNPITNRDVFDTFLWGSYAHRGMNPEFRASFLDWRADPRQFYALKLIFLLMLKILLETAIKISNIIVDIPESQTQ